MINLESGFIVKESEDKIIDGKPIRVIHKVDLLELSVTKKNWRLLQTGKIRVDLKWLTN